LSKKQQQILATHYTHGMTVTQIGKEIGLAQQTVSQHVQYALKILRKKAKSEGLLAFIVPWNWNMNVFAKVIAMNKVRFMIVFILLLSITVLVLFFLNNNLEQKGDKIISMDVPLKRSIYPKNKGKNVSPLQIPEIADTNNIESDDKNNVVSKYVVETLGDFFKKIGSSRIVEIKGKGFEFSHNPSMNARYVTVKKDGFEFEGKDLKSKHVYRGHIMIPNATLSRHGIMIRGVKNLVIRAESPYFNFFNPNCQESVMTFVDCENVTVENLNIGHSISASGCEGNVIELYNCKKMTINKCILFGCGVIGIVARKVTDFMIVNSTIEDCSAYVINLKECENVTFSNCLIQKNKKNGYLLHLTGCKKVLFHRGEISENKAKNLILNKESEVKFFDVFNQYDVENDFK